MPENQNRPTMELQVAGTDFKVLKITASKGAEMPTHHATSEAVICVDSGMAELHIDGQDHPLTPGNSFVLPSGKDHSLSIKEEFKARVILKNDGKIEFNKG